MPTGFALYRSRTLLVPRSVECQRILVSARARNAQLALTGFLHLEDGAFYQWLEGPDAALQLVLDRIALDPRHERMQILSRGTQETRQFPNWQMGFGACEPKMLFNWIAENGVQMGDLRSLTVGVLGFMRACQPAG
ncbi:MAG: BLUF domain-containing protein [Paracoccus sp. (in: a-proteobacteria)]|uniref:BLUF domain-containing protein n=1 Tax=Paracoccus sp. TaxID=267 RepID=UPI0039E352DC